MEISFTENFIELCRDTNLNQSKLANGIGISQSQISRYFKGVIPDIKTVVQICDYFNCSIDYIVGLTDNIRYHHMEKGFKSSSFYVEYDKLLKENNTSHYQLAKKENCLRNQLKIMEERHATKV